MLMYSSYTPLFSLLSRGRHRYCAGCLAYVFVHLCEQRTFTLNVARRAPVPILNGQNRSRTMLKFLGSTIGIIFLIGLLVVIGIFSLIF